MSSRILQIHKGNYSVSTQVLLDVAVRIEALHNAGWAHRDLKPGNIMFVRRTMRWVLIDFGVCAPIGSQASVRGTIKYAAPETIVALREDQRTMVSTGAVDAWSLGMIACEMLLGYYPLGPLVSSDEVCCCSCLCRGVSFCKVHTS